MPPKVIFSSESGRMVSGWGVRAVLPEGTEASPGAPQSSWAQLDCGSGRTLSQQGRYEASLCQELSPGAIQPFLGNWEDWR